jgi:hypothetical protein
MLIDEISEVMTGNDWELYLSQFTEIKSSIDEQSNDSIR